MSINQLPNRPLSGRRIAVDPPLDNLNYQLATGPLEICHVEGNNYVYDRQRDKIIFGLEAEQEIPVKGWDYNEKKYGVVYTELSPHDLAVELHAIPSERDIIADIIQHTPLMARLFSEKELYALMRHEKDALTEAQILSRTNDSLKTEDYRLLSETAGGVLSLPEALSREALAKQLGIENLTPEHAAEYSVLAHARQTEETQNKTRLEALATAAEKKLRIKQHKTRQNANQAPASPSMNFR
jgi:hypothetical protein